MAMTEAQLRRMAQKAARTHKVDPELFERLVTAESDWNPTARSGAGAVGLTQVVPKWHPDADLSTPGSQLDYGAKHLGSLLQKYGNPQDALSVYNSGKPWAEGQGIDETRDYVTKILQDYKPSMTPSTMRRAGAPVAQDKVAAERSAAVLDRLNAMKPSLAQELIGGLGQEDGGGLASAVSRFTTKRRGFRKERDALTESLRQEPTSEPAAASGTPVQSGLRYGGGPEDHAKRALGNWQSDLAYDLMGEAGSPVTIPIGGKVTNISGSPGGDPGFAGYGVTIDGKYFFKHLGELGPGIQVGATVKPGQLIGTLDAATAGGPHLHLGGSDRKALDRLVQLLGVKR